MPLHAGLALGALKTALNMVSLEVFGKGCKHVLVLQVKLPVCPKLSLLVASWPRFQLAVLASNAWLLHVLLRCRRTRSSPRTASSKARTPKVGCSRAPKYSKRGQRCVLALCPETLLPLLGCFGSMTRVTQTAVTNRGISVHS